MPLDFTLHQGAIRSRFRRFIQNMATTRIPVKTEFSVKDGMLRGASHSIAKNSVSIGNDESCDLILVDEGIAAQHLELNFERSLFGGLFSARTGESDVEIGGVPLVPGVASSFEVMPTDITMNHIRIHLSENTRRSSLEASGLGRILDRAFRLGSVAVVALILLWAAGELFFPAAKIQYQLALINSPAEQPAAKFNQGALQAKFLDQLKENGLTEYLEISSNADSAMTVEGVIPSNLVGPWHQAVSWYDRNANGNLLIVRVSEMTGLADFPSIAAIRLTEPAQILFSSGRRARKGTVVNGGWRINEISVDGLKLERRGEFVTLSF